MANPNPGDAMDTTPFTQAITSASTLPSQSQSTSASHPVPQLPADFANQPPPHTLLADPAPAPALPAAVPTIPSSFAAALHLGTLNPSLAHKEPTPYTVPDPTANVPTATGVVRSASMKVFTDDEWGKQRPEDIRDLKKIKFMREDEVKKMSVGELKKAGFGRGKTGYCYSSRMTQHAPIPSTERPGEPPHPEQPARIAGVFRRLESAGLTFRMERIAVREAIKEEITLVHSPAHWDRVRGTGFQTIDYLEACSEYFERLSLYVNPESAFCARLSCGGVIEMCRAVAEGEIRNGFAIVRPPGHHAEPEDAMGFCFFNNAAVAAKWLRTIYDGEQKGPNGEEIKMQKILILDWDVHHGNGTQKAFWDDENVLYMSLHRHDGSFYPGGTYGGADMVGGGQGEGFSVNIPFPDSGMTDADYIYAFQQVVMPIAYEFKPDFVIVSAGYDAAIGDDLGMMKVSPEGFAHMTHMLSVLAKGKLVLALEGGYNVESIAKSALACVEVLLGDEPRHLSIEAASASATEAIQDVIRVQSNHWKCMGTPVPGSDELMTAGKAIPIAEILKAHRTYDLYHEYELYNIEFSTPSLEEAFKDQLLCSDNVYSAKTLVVFMHDLGSIKASFSAATLDLNVEKTLLLDTSREVLDWAIQEQKYGVVDINFLAHLPSQKNQAPDPTRDRKLEKELALYIWDNIVSISDAANIVLFGSGCGASALMNIVQNRPAVKQRVKACISVLGLEPPPELEASSGVRPWYKDNSLVMLPSVHPLHDDARKAGKHQRKYGNIHRATAEDEGRPVHLLKASLPKIKEFIAARIPPVAHVDDEGDVEMGNGV